MHTNYNTFLMQHFNSNKQVPAMSVRESAVVGHSGPTAPSSKSSALRCPWLAALDAAIL
jgi:hypothetical protein